MKEANDFKIESDLLYALMKDLSDADFRESTQFKGWTLNDVLEHLHMWNWAAHESYVNEAGFLIFIDNVISETKGGSLKPYERKWINGLSGRELLEVWRDFYVQMSLTFTEVDPKMRLKWAGPTMSARSSISARLMETWAHGQEIYDHLSVVRKDGDHIKSIVVLGVNTFEWTYATRSEKPLGPLPYVRLTSPSGLIWEFVDVSNINLIEGLASQFCEVVTQVRNVSDTQLRVFGTVAMDWMSKAQCFAGGPETPPKPGARFRSVK